MNSGRDTTLVGITPEQLAALEACAEACYSISGIKSGGWDLKRSREIAEEAWKRVERLKALR